jgi:hypothetical protein
MRKKPKPMNVLPKGKIYVWKGTFAMVKAGRSCRDAVAVIRDRREITCLVEESRLESMHVLAVDRGWKIISFDMILPFGLVGFLAGISGVLADAGISICAFSAFTTDHILVKEEDVSLALSRLESLGFKADSVER